MPGPYTVEGRLQAIERDLAVLKAWQTNMKEMHRENRRLLWGAVIGAALAFLSSAGHWVWVTVR